MPSRWPFLEHPGPLAFAHRGGAGDAPENTLPAFAHAVDLGYRYVETDVHVSADGVLLAFHDSVLDRVTDRVGRVSDLPWSEIRLARVDGVEPIPRLDDLLGAWPDLKVNIDPKHDGAVDALVDVIERTGSIDRVCVGSFSDRRLRRLRDRLGDRLCWSFGPRGTVRAKLASRGLPMGSLTAGCLQVPVRQGRITVVDQQLVDFAHRRELQVHVWTIDDEPEMVRLLDLGVDGIMTDRPAVLRSVLERRGQWHG